MTQPASEDLRRGATSVSAKEDPEELSATEEQETEISLQINKMQHNKRSKMSLVSSLSVALALFLVASGTRAVLVQPYNYLLDDSSMVGRHDHLSPFLNQDQADEAEAEEQSSRSGRSLQDADQEQQLSPEMAELLQESHQAHGAKEGESLSASVANMLLNAAHAAAQASADEAAGASESNQQSEQSDGNQRPSVGARGILELDTSNQQAAPTPSKSDLKPIQWYNPKETIPVLKISSMGKCDGFTWSKLVVGQSDGR